MLIALLLAADLMGVGAVSAAEFQQQAKLCGVSLQYRRAVETGYDAWISPDGRYLNIRPNRKEETVKCMVNWAS